MTRIRAWWHGLSTRSRVVVAAVAVVVVLAVAATGGQPASETAARPTSTASVAPSQTATALPSANAPAATAPVTPSVAPASDTPAPSTADSVTSLGSPIPGLTAADVKLNIEERGFTCEGPTLFLDGVDYVCEDASDPMVDYRVEITGMSPTDIRSVDATILWYGDKAELDARADEFLGYIATLPYGGATPEKARAWVKAHATGTATFGGAKYELSTAGTGLARVLTITGS